MIFDPLQTNTTNVLLHIVSDLKFLPLGVTSLSRVTIYMRCTGGDGSVETKRTPSELPYKKTIHRREVCILVGPGFEPHFSIPFHTYFYFTLFLCIYVSWPPYIYFWFSSYHLYMYIPIHGKVVTFLKPHVRRVNRREG